MAGLTTETTIRVIRKLANRNSSGSSMARSFSTTSNRSATTSATDLYLRRNSAYEIEHPIGDRPGPKL